MQRIQLLPENVANQIAAGEVVERPASVVKELVENAIDAEATKIQVDVEAGGRSLIRVIDDGVGMSRDDALLCLERHATSKIRKATDLTTIETMGFRGEALPSIASVSRFTLTTHERESDDPDGTKIVIKGGKIVDVSSSPGASGTTIEVRNIFFNLPARRKFLRTAETERSHIQHYLQLAALAHPTVGFTYLQDGRVSWQVPPATAAQCAGTDLERLIQRYRALNHDASKMLPLDEEGSFPVHDSSPDPEPTVEQKIRIWGLIGAPGLSRSTRADQHLFVNQRPVENRGLNRALIEGYHTSLMKSRYPVCCLFIEIVPELVDVNVHPAKKEVRFRNEYGVRRFVAEAIKKRLLEFAVPKPITPLTPAIEPSTFDASPAEASAENSGPAAAPTPAPEQQLDLGESITEEPVRTVSSPPTAPKSSTEPPASPQELDSQPSKAPSPNTDPVPESTGPTPLLQVPLRYLGVVGKLYVIYESDRGMVIMDQHAAHERILFEQMLKRMETGEAPSQRLLLAETLELNARDSQFLREQMPALIKLGVGISEFGDQTFLLDALPPFVKVPDAKQFTLEVIDQLKRSGESINKVRLGEDVIAKTVCRHAVKANDDLHPKEIEKLLKDLGECDMPYTCPHGRPTLIELSSQDLEKRFGRVQ